MSDVTFIFFIHVDSYIDLSRAINDAKRPYWTKATRLWMDRTTGKSKPGVASKTKTIILHLHEESAKVDAGMDTGMEIKTVLIGQRDTLENQESDGTLGSRFDADEAQVMDMMSGGGDGGGVNCHELQGQSQESVTVENLENERVSSGTRDARGFDNKNASNGVDENKSIHEVAPKFRNTIARLFQRVGIQKLWKLSKNSNVKTTSTTSTTTTTTTTTTVKSVEGVINVPESARSNHEASETVQGDDTTLPASELARRVSTDRQDHHNAHKNTEEDESVESKEDHLRDAGARISKLHAKLRKELHTSHWSLQNSWIGRYMRQIIPRTRGQSDINVTHLHSESQITSNRHDDQHFIDTPLESMDLPRKPKLHTRIKNGMLPLFKRMELAELHLRFGGGGGRRQVPNPNAPYRSPWLNADYNPRTYL
jgi:hypothetical protein